MPGPQRTLEEQFFASDRTDLDRSMWNRFVRELGVRFRALDKIKIDWEAVSQQGLSVALTRINEVLLPAATRIRDIAELGFLVATSSTERTLVVGQTIGFIIDEDRRDLFTPGPFLAITRTSTPDDYAVGRLIYLDRETGVLDVQVEAIFGDPGPHDDWQFSAVAGAVQAQVQLLASAQGVAQQVSTDKAEILAARDEAVNRLENAAGAVRHDTPQTLDNPAKAQARENISVPSAFAVAESFALVDATLATKADADGMFYRPDRTMPVFEKTGAGTISIKAGAIVEVGRQLYTFNSATAVAMPPLTAGTDYIIWIEPDGDLVANTNFSSPAVAGSRRLGGFHYAPGGNAAAFNSGGNTTPSINEHSIWDLKFRPACADPRGMALIAGSFWCDIYLLGVNHHINGTSKFNVTIADGGSPPKIPTAFGGNGSTAYSSLTWFEAAEVLQSHGKQLLSYDEFAAAMYGTKEAQAGGTDPVSTILRADYTSKWGIMLATGNMWVWGRDFGGDHATASYVSQGRGSAYMLSNVVMFGAHATADDGTRAGSRASYWKDLPSASYASVGARGRSDHLIQV